jgi:hypothetical protein
MPLAGVPAFSRSTIGSLRMQIKPASSVNMQFLANSKSKTMASLFFFKTFPLQYDYSIPFPCSKQLLQAISVFIYTSEQGICAKLRWISIILEWLREEFV